MGRSPKQGFDGFTMELPPAPPPGMILLQRLQVLATPKRAYDISEICENIAANPERASFFCDTSLFDDRTDDRLWAALLNEPGKLVIVPHVYEELKPWLGRRPEHPVAKAIAAGDVGVRLFCFSGLAEWEQVAAEYYINLLGTRKWLLHWGIEGFERQHGRTPDAGELRRIKANVQRGFGERGYLLAKKGFEASKTPTFLTDEELVYFALATAITSGKKVEILSKDEDVQEQFYKLQWLLDTQYRGMLLADLYVRESPRFNIRAMPMDVAAFKEHFQGENNVLIDRPTSLLTEVLPERYTFVPVVCHILGERQTLMVFGAEREMTALLRTKGVTGGLNTERLNGRNCHIWLAPLHVPEELRGYAAVAQDTRHQLSSRTGVPRLDIQQTAFTSERFKHHLPDLGLSGRP